MASPRAAAVRSSSTRALLHAAVAGVGVALLPRMLARGAPTLVEIPPPIPIPKRPAWLATHRDLRRAHPVRVVRDWIVEAIEAAQRAVTRPDRRPAAVAGSAAAESGGRRGMAAKP
ncbi:MAG: LysR substrate-binding domain-containing protein [Candidatus Binatia bacterium]